MIRMGSALQIKAICPDCLKPMDVFEQYAHASLGKGVASDFACVMCYTDGCINRYFIVTIEKKSGMVMYTDAAYIPPQNMDDTWKPIYVQRVDTDGNVLSKPKGKAKKNAHKAVTD